MKDENGLYFIEESGYASSRFYFKFFNLNPDNFVVRKMLKDSYINYGG